MEVVGKETAGASVFIFQEIARTRLALLLCLQRMYKQSHRRAAGMLRRLYAYQCCGNQLAGLKLTVLIQNLHCRDHGRCTEKHIGAGEDIINKTENHEDSVGNVAWERVQPVAATATRARVYRIECEPPRATCGPLGSCACMKFPPGRRKRSSGCSRQRTRRGQRRHSRSR